MKCIVTAGPTYESLDEVRRLTNFSTGRLGSELATYLSDHGHEVTLLIGQSATWRGERRASQVEAFSTTADLLARLRRCGDPSVGALFHAAAVSDFTFGHIWERGAGGELQVLQGGKLSTRQGTLLAELIPTPKIIRELRDLYPRARLVGWKFEVDGNRLDVLAKAEAQILENHTDACVANGRAYGPGFGLVTGPGLCQHIEYVSELYTTLEKFAGST